MATIVILQHKMHQYAGPPYLIRQLALCWQDLGHRVFMHYGTDAPPPGDVCVLHVDLTVVPDDYRALLSQYERVINGKVLNIAKRTFSQNLVERVSNWKGPVIIKTDANHYGAPEWLAQSHARKLGQPVDDPDALMDEYVILQSIEEVPESVWESPRLIVEKFLPERDERGFYLRIWHFFGNQERSIRRRAEVPIVKRANVSEQEYVSVPDEIRAWRDKLGFDFGKFDYLVYEGHPILLDANRTPAGRPISLENLHSRQGLGRLADGLTVYLGQTLAPSRLV